MEEKSQAEMVQKHNVEQATMSSEVARTEVVPDDSAQQMVSMVSTGPRLVGDAPS